MLLLTHVEPRRILIVLTLSSSGGGLRGRATSRASSACTRARSVKTRLDARAPSLNRPAGLAPLVLTHTSRLGQLETAFLALGKRLVIHLEDAA